MVISHTADDRLVETSVCVSEEPNYFGTLRWLGFISLVIVFNFLHLSGVDIIIIIDNSLVGGVIWMDKYSNSQGLKYPWYFFVAFVAHRTALYMLGSMGLSLDLAVLPTLIVIKTLICVYKESYVHLNTVGI